MKNDKPTGYAPWVQTVLAASMTLALGCTAQAQPATAPLVIPSPDANLGTKENPGPGALRAGGTYSGPTNIQGGIFVLTPIATPATAPATAPAACCDPEPATQPATQKMGTVTLNASGQYSGAMTVPGGTLVVSTLPPGTPATQPVANHVEVQSGDGLQKLGTGTLILTPLPPSSGPTTINGGVIYVGPGAVPLPAVTVPVSGALQGLHDVDAKLDFFTAAATKIDNDVRSTDTEIRVGTVYYQKVAGVVSLAFHVDTYSATGVRATAKDEDFVFIPPFYIHRDTTKKEFERTAIAPPGAPAAPLKLGTSVLPLPIGQDPADMVKEFDITELPLDKSVKLPAGTTADNVIVLKLVPRPGTSYDFKQVQLTIDKTLNLPVIIEQTKLDENTSTFRLEKLDTKKWPAATAAKVFETTPPTAPGWKITINAAATAPTPATAPAPAKP